MNKCRGTFLILSTLLILAGQAEAAITTNFMKAVLEVKAGEETAIKSTDGFKFTVINTSAESKTGGVIELIPPEPESLVKDYEAIPDLGWLKLSKDTFALEPSAREEIEITLTVPNDERYFEKKYQAYVWAYTTDAAVGLGVRSKILFTVHAPGEENAVAPIERSAQT